MQAVVLQTVVADDDVATRIRCDQSAGGVDAVAPNPDRAAAALRKQHRFIARYLGCRTGVHRHGIADTAVTAADDARLVSLPPKELTEPKHQWCFSGTSRGNVANHDDGYRHLMGGKPSRPIQCTTQGNDALEQCRDRQQYQGKPGKPVPVTILKRQFLFCSRGGHELVDRRSSALDVLRLIWPERFFSGPAAGSGK